jgi:hypothetical protein
LRSRKERRAIGMKGRSSYAQIGRIEGRERVLRRPSGLAQQVKGSARIRVQD